MTVIICWLFPKGGKIVTVIQTSSASVLFYRCHWEMKISHPSMRIIRWSQFPTEAVSKPYQNLQLQRTLPWNFSYSNGKGLAALSLKRWRQHALLKNITRAWSFSRKKPYTNGTPRSHIKHCAVVFVPDTAGKQIFLWGFFLSILQIQCEIWKTVKTLFLSMIMINKKIWRENSCELQLRSLIHGLQ